MPNKSPQEHYRELFETFMEIPDDSLARALDLCG